MRLLLLESEPANILRIQSIFSFPITVDHTASLEKAHSYITEHQVEALIFCHLEWLPTLQEAQLPIPLVFVPVSRSDLRQLGVFPFREQPLQFARLQLFPLRRQVVFGKHELLFRKTEYELLQNFLKYPETTLKYSFLIQHTWLGWHRPKLNTLHRHISNLRQKLRLQATGVRIKTVQGVGYRLEAL